ncbi:hypothetical protein [Ligilactobacillus salivarius]|uniref:hypothetical protein n=1 Tax=Ligilactobacillus salivarius TaxID=1624 RepID=UPI00202378DF|nr:hypothetical protein [Ligilactobacillus salivarius]URI13143.1 hypothetical protein M9Y03_01580 [Ligilactobacillus salivarius]UUB34977.1 hypothetical protein NO469_01580 [Ligilactobacillus salivarius]
MNTKRKLLLFISGMALILLFTIMNTNTVKAAVTWPTTSFATWTQGRRFDGSLTRNIYGFIINKDEGYYMEEYKDSGNIHIKIPLIAHQDWNKSDNTKYYLVMQNGNNISGQMISNVTRTKIKDYSRTSLWMLDVTVGNIKADKIQICIYDDGSYGFWRTNGVADDGTYPFVMSTPVLGWNNVTNFNQSLKDGIFYVGRNTTLTMNAPKLQDSNVGKFDNSILNNAGESHFFGQNVVNNEIRTTYEITTDVTKLDGIVDGLASSNTNKYGLDTTLTYEIPSDNLTIPLVYGGLKPIVMSVDNLDNTPINTKDFLEASFIDKIISDLKNNHTLTYSWFYSTSDKINDLKKVSTEFPSNTDFKPDGNLGTDWMILSSKNNFTQYLMKQAIEGKKTYLMMKVYVDGKLSTLTNPILVQIQVPTLKVPDKIDFGTISVKNIYNGGSFESLTKDSDKLSLSIPDTSKSTWKVTSSIKENDDNSITKINGQLNILGKNLSATPIEVASISKHGLVDLPLNAKVSFRGYHNPLTPRTNFTEDINWNLSPETPIMASN